MEVELNPDKLLLAINEEGNTILQMAAKQIQVEILE
jgi:hypothetical protein